MQDIRKERLGKRDSLDLFTLKRLSARVGGSLLQLEEVAASVTVMFYASFRSEVDTFAPMRQALESGIRVVLPVTKMEEKILVPRLINDIEREMKPGYCSIMEPVEALTEKVDVSEIDIVIVPGSVFDLNGGRMGYGGGYYDRFLAHPNCTALRVGLCFELQIVKDLPLEPHDQLLDILVTEKKVYRFK